MREHQTVAGKVKAGATIVPAPKRSLKAPAETVSLAPIKALIDKAGKYKAFLATYQVRYDETAEEIKAAAGWPEAGKPWALEGEKYRATVGLVTYDPADAYIPSELMQLKVLEMYMEIAALKGNENGETNYKAWVLRNTVQPNARAATRAIRITARNGVDLVSGQRATGILPHTK